MTYLVTNIRRTWETFKIDAPNAYRAAEIAAGRLGCKHGRYFVRRETGQRWISEGTVTVQDWKAVR